MTGWGSHCERLKGARQSPLWFFMSLRKASKGILLPLRNSRLLRRHETKTPPRNDGLEKRLPRRAAPSFAMMGCRRLLRRHKVAPSRWRRKKSLRGHASAFYGRGNRINFEEVRGPSSILYPESQIQDCFTSFAMTCWGSDCFVGMKQKRLLAMTEKKVIARPCLCLLWPWQSQLWFWKARVYCLILHLKH